MFPVLLSASRKTVSLAQRIAAVVGASSSFYLPGPAYFFSDAAGTVPCADTDLIRVWRDASANGRDLTQATSGSRPVARLIGGMWRGVFDGVDDFLDVPDAVIGGVGTGDVTVYAVASVTESTGYRAVLSSTGADPLIGQTNAIQTLFWSGASERQGTGSLTLGQWYVMGWERASGVTTLYRDGVSVGGGAQAVAAATTGYTFGGRPSAGQLWHGGIAALVTRQGALSAGQRTSLVSLLAGVTP